MKQLGEMTLSEMSEVYNWTWSRYRRRSNRRLARRPGPPETGLYLPQCRPADLR